METLQDGRRYDEARRRKSQRHGPERGVRIFIPARELRKAGIDPDGPPPEYRVWATSGGGFMLRLYRD